MTDPDEDSAAQGKSAVIRSAMSRRQLLKVAGSSLAASALVSTPAAMGQSRDPAPPRQSDLTGRLARYMVAARDAALPGAVVLEAKHRILDTLGAIVSGARLKPGEVAVNYVRGLGGTPEASVATTDILTNAVNAALTNAMFAHADETDDFHPFTKAHPGCAVVPAALAMGERQGSSGTELLRAIVLGYDCACRILMALGPAFVRARNRSAEGYSSTFGAAAAAASLARFDELHMRYAISFAVQQISGVWSWTRDVEHIEKAFDFSGMGARNGVAAATMVQAGFTGVTDALDGTQNFIDALSTEPAAEELVADLGSRFYVQETAIKTYPVGYPIQSPLAALMQLREEQGFATADVDRLVVRLPADGARIVDSRSMPDVNVQHILAMALVDGHIDFENSHSFDRMQDPAVLNVKQRIELIADEDLVVVDAPRSGYVEVRLKDGHRFDRFVSHAPGTPENPLDTAGVAAKARSLMQPVLGAERTSELIRQVENLERLDDTRELRPLITV